MPTLFPGAPIIALSNLSMVFEAPGPGAQVVALQGASLRVLPGEFVSLIGPSGCGKTTLLRLMADLLQPSSGELSVNGQTPRQAREQRAYGYVFQAPALMEWRDVLENVMLPLEVMHASLEQRRARAQDMLALVGLQDFAHAYPWQLSGGMQQRVSLARALTFDPPLLLMDEPFGALDELTRENLNLELLRLWRETGKTVIFVTHSITEAVFLSSRVVVMTARPGKIEGIVNIDLPRPRSSSAHDDPRFAVYTRQIRELLRRGAEPGGAGPAHLNGA